MELVELVELELQSVPHEPLVPPAGEERGAAARGRKPADTPAWIGITVEVGFEAQVQV